MTDLVAPIGVADDTLIATEEPQTPSPSSSDNSLQAAFADLKPKMKLVGKVKRTEIQGAIIDVGMEHDGLLHISQLSTENVKNVTDVVKEGDEITVYILSVDAKKGRLDLTLVPMPEMGWNDIREGMDVEGTVERIEKYGVFVNIGAERPALIHVSQLAGGYVAKPEDVVKLGDTIKARVIGINRKKKQIDLSVRELEASQTKSKGPSEEELEEQVAFATAMELALQKAMETGDHRRDKNDRKRRKKDYDDGREDIIARTLRFNRD